MNVASMGQHTHCRSFLCNFSMMVNMSIMEHQGMYVCMYVCFVQHVSLHTMKFGRSKSWSVQRKKLKPKKCGSIYQSVYMCDVYSLRR